MELRNLLSFLFIDQTTWSRFEEISEHSWPSVPSASMFEVKNLPCTPSSMILYLPGYLSSDLIESRDEGFSVKCCLDIHIHFWLGPKNDYAHYKRTHSIKCKTQHLVGVSLKC